MRAAGGWLAILCVLAPLASQAQTAANPRPFTIPAVQTWKGGRGALTLTPQSRIVYTDPALRTAAELLARDWQVAQGLRLDAVQGVSADRGDVFLTLTGDKDILRTRHFASMKNGAILANSGHFDVEINIPELEAMSVSRKRVKPNIEEFLQKDGRKIYLLAEGRLVNLAAGDGHPAEIMDLSFAVQFFSALHLLNHHKEMEKKVYLMPNEINEKIARIKLDAMGIKIDTLTPEQKAYLGLE